MAAITEVIALSGQTLYCTIHAGDAKLANGASTEVYNGSNWSTYVNTLSEQGTTGYYTGSFPSYLVAGKYTIVFYQQAGGSAAVGDPVIGSGQIYFDGTIEEQGTGKVLVKYLLDKLVLATAGGTLPTIGSFLDQIMNKDAGQTFSQSVASLQALQAGGSGPTAAQIANQVWDTVLPGFHTVPLSGGSILDFIYARMPGNGAGSQEISSFNPAATGVNLNANQSGATIGTVNALGTTALASVAAQVAAALNATAMPELASAPGATPTVYQALMFAYMSLRNGHTATSSQEKIQNNAGTVIAAAALSDDGNTFTKGKFS